MGTNNLKYNVTKSNVNYYNQNADIIVKIRLNDECKNGHQDFAITADIYKAGKRGDKYFLAGGCCHEDILKYFPEFKIFVELHLCDAKGIPMYAASNGFYHLKNGFNSKSTGIDFEHEYCKYYRITPEQFSILKNSENILEFSILLKDLGILDQWKKQANEAILYLETLTGNIFINDSVKNRYTEPTPEQIEEFKKLKESGYYSKEQKEQRAKNELNQKTIELFEKIEKKAKEDIEKIQLEKKIKVFILKRLNYLYSNSLLRKKGFDQNCFFDNYIYYNHSNRIKFNWSDSQYYKKMSDFEFKTFCYSLKQIDFDYLPNGISFECNGSIYSL